MARSHRQTPFTLFRAFRQLSRPQQIEFKNLVAAHQAQEEGRWMTLEEAMDILGKSKSQVSRYIRAEKLVGNGQRGTRALRVLRLSVGRKLLEEAIQEIRRIRHAADKSASDLPVTDSEAEAVAQQVWEDMPLRERIAFAEREKVRILEEERRLVRQRHLSRALPLLKRALMDTGFDRNFRV